MDSLPVNVTDVAIVIVVIVSGLFAFLRGFMLELLATASWIGAGVATFHIFPYAEPLALDLVDSPLIAQIGAGVTIFLVILIALSVVARYFARRFRDSGLAPLDRSLGLVFGLARGAVLVCIAWMVLVALLPPSDRPDWITQARSLPLVERGAATLWALVPDLKGKAPGLRSEDRTDDGAAFRGLLAPTAKSHAPADRPGYKLAQRNAMRRLIEAATHRISRGAPDVDSRGPDP